MFTGVGTPVQPSYGKQEMFIVAREIRWWFQSLLFKIKVQKMYQTYSYTKILKFMMHRLKSYTCMNISLHILSECHG